MEKELASLLMSSFTEFFCLFLVLLFPSWWWSLHLFSGFSMSGAKNETSFHLVCVPSMNGKRHRYNSLKRKDSAWNANIASRCHLLYDSLRTPGLLFSTFHYQCFSPCFSSLYAFFNCYILLLHAFLSPLLITLASIMLRKRVRVMNWSAERVWPSL